MDPQHATEFRGRAVVETRQQSGSETITSHYDEALAGEVRAARQHQGLAMPSLAMAMEPSCEAVEEFAHQLERYVLVHEEPTRSTLRRILRQVNAAEIRARTTPTRQE